MAELSYEGSFPGKLQTPSPFEDSRKTQLNVQILFMNGAGSTDSYLTDGSTDGEKYEVVVEVDYFAGSNRNLKKWIGHHRFKLVHRDVTEPLQVNIDQIYHLSCAGSPILDNYNAINVIGELLGLANHVGARISLTSTSEVYGYPHVHPQTDYYYYVNPIGIRRDNFKEMHVSETSVFDYCSQPPHGIEICLAGIFNTYGPRINTDGGLVVRNFIAQALRGETLIVQASGTQAKSICYVAYNPVGHLPREVTLDIFSRLGVESVIDCKLVCKDWRDLLQCHADNFFADLHLRNQLGRRLMLQQEQHKQFLDHDSIHDCSNSEMMSFFGFDGHAFYCAEYHPGGEITDKKPNYQTKTVNIKFPDSVHEFVGSCNGLICLSVKSKYKTIFYDNNGVERTWFKNPDEPSYICNPITREYVNLPRVSIDEKKGRYGIRIVHGFGYYPPTNEYKVVRISYFGNTNVPPFKGEVEVYTLGSDSGWRSVGETNYLLLINCYGASVCTDGALYWFQKRPLKIVAFDLGEEEFYVLPSPACTIGSAKLCIIRGFLCLLSECLDTELWFLRKNKENSNSCQTKEQYYKSWSWSIVFCTRGINIDDITGSNILAITKRDEILLGCRGKVILYNIETRTSKVISDRKGSGSWLLPHSHVNSFVSLNALGESNVLTILDKTKRS